MDHWPLFEEFCRQEIATGGPDPQLAIMTYFAKQMEDPVERVWLAGCYCSHHCVPSAHAVFEAFRPRETLRNPDLLYAFLQDHWTALPVRPEMKSHRMIQKRFDCLTDFLRYAVDGKYVGATDYEYMWATTIENVAYYGRYMAIKYLELLRRIVAPDLIMPDMRVKNGWSPRIALGMLYPEVPILAERQNIGKEALDAVTYHADQTIIRLEHQGIHTNFFSIQVLLCEYKEAMQGGYYPGASHDEELDYMRISRRDFDVDPIIVVRAQIFPHEVLGEIGGWNGVRKDKFQIFKGAKA
jgi:hypothetical protein